MINSSGQARDDKATALSHHEEISSIDAETPVKFCVGSCPLDSYEAGEDLRRLSELDRGRKTRDAFSSETDGGHPSQPLLSDRIHPSHPMIL